MKIQVAVTCGPGGDLSIEELILTRAKPDGVLIKIAAAGMRHTDAE